MLPHQLNQNFLINAFNCLCNIALHPWERVFLHYVCKKSLCHNASRIKSIIMIIMLIKKKCVKISDKTPTLIGNEMWLLCEWHGPRWFIQQYEEKKLSFK